MRPILVIEYNEMLNYLFPKSCKKKFHYIEQLYMGKSLNPSQLRKIGKKGKFYVILAIPLGKKESRNNGRSAI